MKRATRTTVYTQSVKGRGEFLTMRTGDTRRIAVLVDGQDVAEVEVTEFSDGTVNVHLTESARPTNRRWKTQKSGWDNRRVRSLQVKP